MTRTGFMPALGTLLMLLCASYLPVRAQEGAPPIIGRWDITVHGPRGDYPSWLEVTPSGSKTLVGSFVGEVGSARPISQVFFANGKLEFSLPVQWEADTGNLRFEGTLDGDRLSGTTVDARGRSLPWTARRAPKLRRTNPPVWDRPQELFNGKDLQGWQPRSPRSKNNWSVKDGLLVNRDSGSDLVSSERFTDFKLHAEYRYPKDSNSGLYLRGRYEVQIQDDYGQDPDKEISGGVYGFLIPRINAVKPHGEWEVCDVTLVGRTVTVVLNGETILDRQVIPGITGGALDSDEGAPGPLLIQGDHGPIEFRRVAITPAK